MQAGKIKRKKTTLNLRSIPNMLYNSVKIALEDMTEVELAKCIKLLMQGMINYALHHNISFALVWYNIALIMQSWLLSLPTDYQW